jgi:hypothetical protein
VKPEDHACSREYLRIRTSLVTDMKVRDPQAVCQVLGGL